MLLVFFDYVTGIYCPWTVIGVKPLVNSTHSKTLFVVIYKEFERRLNVYPTEKKSLYFTEEFPVYKPITVSSVDIPRCKVWEIRIWYDELSWSNELRKSTLSRYFGWLTMIGPFRLLYLKVYDFGVSTQRCNDQSLVSRNRGRSHESLRGRRSHASMS